MIQKSDRGCAGRVMGLVVAWGRDARCMLGGVVGSAADGLCGDVYWRWCCRRWDRVAKQFFGLAACVYALES